MTQHISVSELDRVLVIQLDRPERKNALTQAMYGAIADALDAATADDQCRAVIITGTGDAFTAGNDLTDFATGATEGKPPVQRFLETIRDTDLPVIAAVNGVAVGVGLTMLLHCDLAFAAESATFRAPFPQVGVVPEAGSSMLLPLTVGMAWANDILLAGRVLNASEALQAGLVSRVLADDELLDRAMEVAQSLAASAPNAMRQSKQLIRQHRAIVAERMADEAVRFAAQLASPEFAECTAAFMQKRKPVFG